MIGDIGRRSQQIKRVARPPFTRMVVHLESKPIPHGDTPQNNRNLQFTNLQYTIRYSRSRFANRGWSFIISADFIVEKSMRFNTMEELQELCKKDARAKWLYDNTELSNEKYWELVKEYSPLSLPLRVDLLKYVENLKKQVQQNPDLGDAVLLPPMIQAVNDHFVEQLEETYGDNIPKRK